MIARFSQFDFADVWTFIVFPVFPLACWIICLFLAIRRRRLLSLEERKEVPWGAIDVVLVLGSMLFAKFLSQMCSIVLISWKTGMPLDKIDQQIALKNSNILVGTGIVFSILQLIAVVAYLKKTQGGSWADLGWDRSRLKRHLGVGLVAALMIIPLILITNIVLHAILRVEYSHQVMIMVRYSLLTTAVSTILIAPIVEEFHFRVVLQGFLQRIYDLDLEKKVKIIQGDRLRPESLIGMNQPPDKPKKSKPAKSVPLWPILISSFMFAFVHMGQGAAPYALFVFALFLGYLYRQTNSILPCIIVHLLLNLWSFVALVYSLE